MSDIKKTIETLREFNLWRRSDEDMDQPDPWEIGQAIDAAIEAMEELREWQTLTGWGGTPEVINDFIKGQQSRIYAAQEAEEQRDRLAEELDALKQSMLDLSHPNMKLLLEERNEAREQRDRLAAIARELTAMIRINVMVGRFAECSVEQIDEHLKPWNEKIAAVEGGSHDN